MEIKKPAMAGTVRQPDPQGSPSDTGEPGRKGCKNFSGGQGRAGLYH